MPYPIQNRKVEFHDLGLIAYQEAWDFQTKLFQELVEGKANPQPLPAGQAGPDPANRRENPHRTEDNNTLTPQHYSNTLTPQHPNTLTPQHPNTPNHLIFCEHPHVFTLGKSGDESNLLVPKEKLDTINASFVPINRGGDITYHGPGQLVVYPIFDLDNFFTDIHKFMRTMEEAVILTLKEFGIEAGRMNKLTGVWLDADHPAKARKICAMGVKMSRWVTMHGLALNVNPDLNYFNYIVPCGITDKAVTSMEKELHNKVDMAAVKEALKKNLYTEFQLS